MLLGYSSLGFSPLAGGVVPPVTSTYNYGFIVGYSSIASTVIGYGIVSTAEEIDYNVPIGVVDLSYIFGTESPADSEYVINPGLVVPPAIDSPILISFSSLPDITSIVSPGAVFPPAVDSPILISGTSSDVTFIINPGLVIPPALDSPILIYLDPPREEITTSVGIIPTVICEGYTSDGTNITIPISCLPGLTALEADAVSGDWRDIFQAICIMSHNWVNNYGVTESLRTYDSYFIQNPNSKRSFFQYGIGEQNLFLEKFVVKYSVSKLKAEN